MNEGVNDRVYCPRDLNQLVSKACYHPAGSVERQKVLDRLVRAIQASKKLWRENTPYYEDALQKTWFYLCRNLCEAVTTNLYDPEKASVITWLNNYLKHRLKDFERQKIEELRNTEPIRIGDEGNPIDPVPNIPARPNVPPIEVEIGKWLETDPKEELNSIHVKGYPEVTIKALIERRLPDNYREWTTIAEEFGIQNVSTLRSFYNRQCKPRLREFGQQQEYVE